MHVATARLKDGEHGVVVGGTRAGKESQRRDYALEGLRAGRAGVA